MSRSTDNAPALLDAARRMVMALINEGDPQSLAIPEGIVMAGGANSFTQIYDDLARAVRSAPLSPKGWKLVPIEPDAKMKKAAQKAHADHSPHREWLEQEWPIFKELWDAMIESAPQGMEQPTNAMACNYPDCDGGHATGCCRDSCRPKVTPAEAWSIVKEWLGTQQWEEDTFSRYRDDVILDGVMSAGARRAISAVVSKNDNRSQT